MAPIPVSILGGLFVAWLLGVAMVLAVLWAEADRSEQPEEPDHRKGPHYRFGR